MPEEPFLGPPDRSARPFDGFTLPFRLLLLAASVATMLVALWLLSAIAFVLPERDPAHIPMWRILAGCFLAYGALTWTCLVLGPRNVALRSSVRAVSLAAMGFGLYAIGTTIRMANGGHFEGYLVLMGLILFGHGLSAIVYTLLAGRVARRIKEVPCDVSSL